MWPCAAAGMQHACDDPKWCTDRASGLGADARERVLPVQHARVLGFAGP